MPKSAQTGGAPKPADGGMPKRQGANLKSNQWRKLEPFGQHINDRMLGCNPNYKINVHECKWI